MMNTQQSQTQLSTFVLGAIIGASFVALMTTNTGHELLSKTRQKARNLRKHGKELIKNKERNEMNPYDTPLSPS